MNRAVFIDRDGTIAKDVPYCDHPDKLEIFPNVGEGIKLLKQSNYLVIMITNQSGIGRGYFTEETLGQIHHKMALDLQGSGANLDAIYYCPHHPDTGCNCRKPNTGLLEKSIKDWNIDIENSYFIGDKFLDAEAANKIGCRAILVPSSQPELGLFDGVDGHNVKVELVSPDFFTATKWITSDTNQYRDVSIIVPTKNESANLRHVLPKLPRGAEIIIVDGKSTDGTVEAAILTRRNVKILQQEGTGKGDAMKLGFSKATGNIIITFDADGSFNASEISRIVEPLRQGYDLVKGSRFLPGGGTSDMPPFRRFGNWIFTTTANVLLGAHYKDLVYGFHGFRREILDKIKLESTGFEIDTELYCRVVKAGLKVKEVPSFENKRLHGTSNLNSFKDGWRILKTIINIAIGK